MIFRRPAVLSAILLLSSTTANAQTECTQVTSWSELKTAVYALKKNKTLLLCPFDIIHEGNLDDGLDLWHKGLTLACQGTQSGDVADDTMYRGGLDGVDGTSVIPVGCTIRGRARHFNILGNSISLVGITFDKSQHGAVSVGEWTDGTTISNCKFNNNVRVVGDGGAIVLGTRSTGTVLVGCEFNRNGAWGGGAVSGMGSEVVVRDCLFRGNRATIGVGGAMKLVDQEVDDRRLGDETDVTSRETNNIKRHGRLFKDDAAAAQKQKQMRRQLSRHKSNKAYIVSILTISDTRFMSNSAALAGPAVYQETTWDDTNVYISTRAEGNYGCANLALSTSHMCNGITDGTECIKFANTCDKTPIPITVPAEEVVEVVGGLVDKPQAGGGTTGLSDDLGPETGPAPEEEPYIEGEEDFSDDGGLDLRDGDVTTTESPTTEPPSDSPTTEPPTEPPSDSPTTEPPTEPPSESPTTEPPTEPPSESPTTEPPSESPTTASPSESPTTASPSESPTTASPTTTQPTALPTFVPTSSPTYQPTPEPTVVCNMDEVARHSAILARLGAISDPTDLRRVSTPQGKAVDWLVFDDDMYLCPDDAYLMQRYILAVLYYSTNGENGWLTCSREGDVENECPSNGRFLGENHECTWAGIGCNADDFVTKIAFEENGLAGTIPSELGALSALRTLRMEHGQLSGPIPETIGDLTHLEKLDMDFNNLWGTLPSSFENLENLKLIDLNNNDLSGSIDVLSGLSKLFFVQLHTNYFSGTVPEALPKLQVFAIHDNQLVGEIALDYCALRINGQLQHLEADCADSADGGTVSCICCTQCFPQDDTAINKVDGEGTIGGRIPDTSITAPPTSLPTSQPTSSPTGIPEPTYVPTPFTNAPTAACGGISKGAWRESIANSLAGSGISTRSNLLTKGTPQAKALSWLINKDPLQLCPGDERIEQRYLAALFYYSTNGEDWLDKGSGNQKYLGSAGECYWKGLRCNSYGEITHVTFENNGLSGSIPYEIASFTNLEVLSLEKGDVTGRIPGEIGSMQNLRELDLDFNLLTGHLPDTLGNAPQLSVVDLNSNLLTGNINALGGVKKAYFMQLHNNQFTGTVPPAIGLLGNLQVLTIHKNNIQGVMPIMVCNRIAVFGGTINHLWADCGGTDPKVSCSCCSKCFE